MLLVASSFGGSASLHAARGFHQLRRSADGCSSRSRPRERRSDLARTPAEVLVADLNRPARGLHGRGHAFGFRQDGARCFFFFFNDTATPEIYTLSLHDALPI